MFGARTKFRLFDKGSVAGIALGLIAGLVISGALPSVPLRAVASDHTQNFILATGAIDEDTEALFFLDSITGDLNVAVIGKQSGRFNGFFKANVLADMKADASKNPQFLMVTGMCNLRRSGARLQPGKDLVYVTETTTGMVVAYAVPWSPAMHAGGQSGVQPLVKVDSTYIRSAAAQSAHSSK